ncbi:MAG: sigma-70 family RNA polymerase sigma factor [Solirubrobacteraceae bacterium]
MTESTLARASGGDEQAFRALTEPYRRELQVHCYRILGSLQDAEDALQETLVSAWRGLDRFEQRSSLRAWLHGIATNRCLNMLRDSARRPRSTSEPFFEPPPPPTRMGEVTWLEPYPDALLEALADAAPGPEARYDTREAVGLAFITALQRLPARPRAVLVLRDVLGFRAAEAAEMLDTTEATVNSALQRARSALGARLPPARERAPAPGSQHERELADSFAEAFDQGDVDRVITLLTEDAWVTMPPEPFEYQGREMIASFLEHVVGQRTIGGRTRLIPTRANGQPAFGHYVAAPGAETARGSGLLALTLAGGQISQITRFGGPALLSRFGLPSTLSLPYCLGSESQTRPVEDR